MDEVPYDRSNLPVLWEGAAAAAGAVFGAAVCDRGAGTETVYWAGAGACAATGLRAEDRPYERSDLLLLLWEGAAAAAGAVLGAAVCDHGAGPGAGPFAVYGCGVGGL